MLAFLTLFTRLFLSAFASKKDLLIRIALLEKQLQILSRGRRHRKTQKSDRVIFSVLHRLQDIRSHFYIFRPETLLKWERELRKHFWTFNKKYYPGRPPISAEVRDLVIQMKNSCLFWGYGRIEGELQKLGINIDRGTVANIIRSARKRGKIEHSLTWRKFLTSQIDSIFAMDFFTVDTILGKRFYVYFIISHRSREIVRFAVTENPISEFVRQQLILFKEVFTEMTYLIHDGAGEFCQNYGALKIRNIRTSAEAPNMNSIAERVIGSVRRELLDNFIILNRKQLLKMLTEYFDHYNSRRPHQGIEQQSPKGYEVQRIGRIRRVSLLAGLFSDWFRDELVRI